MNETAKWIGGNWDWFVGGAKQGIIGWKVPLPKGEVDDMVHDFILSVIQHDYLVQHIVPRTSRKGEISLSLGRAKRSQVGIWAARFALRRLRKMAQDVAWRESMGARTPTEVHHSKPAPALPAPLTEISLEDKVLGNQLWAQVASDLKKRYPKRGKVYARILWRHIEGWTIEEIVQQEGKTYYKVADTLAKVRKFLRAQRAKPVEELEEAA